MTYVPHGEEDRARMLEAVGVESVDALFAPIPERVRRTTPLDLPPALGEEGVLRHMEALAGANRTGLASFLGAGCYDHFVPPAVDALAGRSEFYTAYTPYQPETSQGVLQAFFEYQSLICELTGLDVANASMYDGATALAEAMVLSHHARPKGRRVVLSEGIHPEWRAVTRTYLSRLGVDVAELPLENGRTPASALAEAAKDAAGAAIQSPNWLGFVEDVGAAASAAHASGALLAAAVDPISLAVLESPGALGADLAVGEGQALGCPMSFGGPHFGFFAARQEFVRQLPGRVVGATVDDQGRRGFVLTFQTREQHIRREKATSNICTNQGLMALRAAIHLALLGPRGLHEVACESARKARLAAEAIRAVPGFALLHDAPFFREFPVITPAPAERIVEALVEDGFLAGVPLRRLDPAAPEGLLVAVTERRTEAEIEGLADALRRRFGGRRTA